ncbi:hypothetical protein [Sulfuriroseicoccus oceanibius]|uniref:Uncharacterized protein n=1 Tax=Sulfuriroseicoccus oceanibius TaxID=2707525 RepID=A0A6B3LAE6_9BACT|nr:hypothetical protein [Sulfuriroseicoccus oceanibius]QQL43820.1 hypothetical protein G3M56_007905 [Sulfuriroseicoccus oceanibius]
MPEVRFRSGSRPTQEELDEVMNWATACVKVDRDYRFRFPIACYGKIVNQHGVPMVNVEVEYEWQGARLLEPETEGVTYTNEKGEFTIKGMRGWSMVLDFKGQGVYYTGSYDVRLDFSDPLSPIFHESSSDQRHEFMVLDVSKAEPMYSFSEEIHFIELGKPYEVAFPGHAEEPPLQVSLEIDDLGQKEEAYRLMVAADGGLVKAPYHRHFLLHEAPQHLYQESVVFEWPESSPADDRHFAFYMRDADGRYAVVQGEVFGLGYARRYVRLDVRYNPSGSRNLLYDRNQTLSRKWNPTVK